MRQIKAILILTSLLFFYACAEEINPPTIVETKEIIPEPAPILVPENDDCDFAVENIGMNGDDDSPVELIGLFENLKQTEEHTYGYALMMWEVENEMIGFLNVYEGDLEPNRSGPIMLGSSINDSLYFKVWTKQNKSYKYWEQSVVHIFTFEGLLTANKISGTITNLSCAEDDAVSIEKFELSSSNIWDLESFNNIAEWKSFYDYQLTY
ncbi:hypothetical protein [Crocinitomix catalasitica]|uniref:hypothetical protein n=1 Tax=Crocinitomix catalasitica TaxID=184607 RepID=UPI000483EF4F|nr:hypothetical protein [Crocinitomix catalasitica]